MSLGEVLVFVRRGSHISQLVGMIDGNLVWHPDS